MQERAPKAWVGRAASPTSAGFTGRKPAGAGLRMLRSPLPPAPRPAARRAGFPPVIRDRCIGWWIASASGIVASRSLAAVEIQAGQVPAEALLRAARPIGRREGRRPGIRAPHRRAGKPTGTLLGLASVPQRRWAGSKGGLLWRSRRWNPGLRGRANRRGAAGLRPHPLLDEGAAIRLGKRRPLRHRRHQHRCCDRHQGQSHHRRLSVTSKPSGEPSCPSSRTGSWTPGAPSTKHFRPIEKDDASRHCLRRVRGRKNPSFLPRITSNARPGKSRPQGESRASRPSRAAATAASASAGSSIRSATSRVVAARTAAS